MICFYSPTYLFNDLFISARTPTLGCNPYTLDYSLILLYSLCCSNFLAVATGRSSGWFLCPFDISFLILIFFKKSFLFPGTRKCSNSYYFLPLPKISLSPRSLDSFCWRTILAVNTWMLHVFIATAILLFLDLLS